MLARPGLPEFEYHRVDSPDQVVQLLLKHGEEARLLMGGTDLLVRMRNGDIRPQVVIDTKCLPGIRDIRFDVRTGLTIGAATTMNQIARHPDVRRHYPLLAEAAYSVASYQLRNRATIGGNLANASPCADTAPATLVLRGQIVLYGPEGVRSVSVDNFFTGPGQTIMQFGEFLTAVRFPPPMLQGAGRYLKLGRNLAGDLALVSVAIFAFPTASTPSGYRFRIALGAVAPVPLRALEAEDVLAANPPTEEFLALAAEKAMAAASPIDDVRASAAYRRAMVHNLARRGLYLVGAAVTSTNDLLAMAGALGAAPRSRVSPPDLPMPQALSGRSFPLSLTVNGVREQLDVPANMTLLQMLRERLALTGTKNGCAAGECGACTVLMDGEPVNACMVLAVEADGAEIVTVEGLAQESQLDALQTAFVDEGAIQCGFCTPGMLISAKALLDRSPAPGEGEIRAALLGNLCRCTGYNRIVKAVKRVAGDTQHGNLQKEGGQ